MTKKLSYMRTGVRRKNNGFTLIEMLIGIMVLGTAISLLSMSVSQSVRQQEKMSALLDIYQTALTVKPQIQAALATGDETGVISQGKQEVNWSARILDEKREAAIIDLESGESFSANRLIKLYEVEVWIESDTARRVFTFKHAQRHIEPSAFQSPFSRGRR